GSATRSRGDRYAGPLELRARGLDPAEVVASATASRGFCIDAVQARGVEPEDLRLHLVGELGIAELLTHPLRDLERTERVDHRPVRPVPDRVGAPDDVVLAEREEQLAEHVRG